MKIDLSSLAYESGQEKVRKQVRKEVRTEVQKEVRKEVEKVVRVHEEGSRESEARASDIAIIGLACRFPMADNAEEFWQNLVSGANCVGDFPRHRQLQTEEMVARREEYDSGKGYYAGGFLADSDCFDHQFFGISPTEASLMSPEQRNILEVAYTAIEEAGYGNGRLSGSRTGIYIGHSTDFGIIYKEFVNTLNPDMKAMGVSGNLNGLIAGRLAYLLDLHGPCMIVDTACSSVMVAIHTACEALLGGDCDVALAGSCKFDLLPLVSLRDGEDVGINAEDGKTRSFDYQSQGAGWGEGVGVLILKPLAKAQKDGDIIHAVIKGTAINQDGTSANLTSPNSDAQAEVIRLAWKKADIDPETISYIEAHGTGTALGDPIEIAGITKAFAGYTDKKQFCGVGSVKSNMGHLEHAAGCASMIKAIFSLKNKQLAPSINFTSPNPRIAFENSPVYVNTRLREWQPECGIRRCGVSGYGLSGTNCHIILEEAPEALRAAGAEPTCRLLPVSADSKEGVLNYLWKYQEILHRQPDLDPELLMLTAGTGRYRGTFRAALCFRDIAELRHKLELLYLASLAAEAVNGGSLADELPISKADPDQERKPELLISKAETDPERKQELTERAASVLRQIKTESIAREEGIITLARLFVQGAEPDFSRLAGQGAAKKISLPTYPFMKTTHWVKPVTRKTVDVAPHVMASSRLHPLLHRLAADTYDRVIFESRFRTRDTWEIKDHVVAGIPLLPGTSYIEMIKAAMKSRYGDSPVVIKDLVFMSPLLLKEDEEVTVHLVIRVGEEEAGRFTIIGRVAGQDQEGGNRDWVMHAQGSLSLHFPEELHIDLGAIRKSCGSGKPQNYGYEAGASIEMSDRWECGDELYTNGTETLAFLSLPEKYLEEAKAYQLYPALLDEAANTSLRTVGKGLYLPFSYRKVTIYQPLTRDICSYVKRKDRQQTEELATFDITVTDPEGRVLLTATDYTVKKAGQSIAPAPHIHDACRMSWKEAALLPDRLVRQSGGIILVRSNDRAACKLKEALAEQDPALTPVNLDSCHTEEDFAGLARRLRQAGHSSFHIVFAGTLPEDRSGRETPDAGAPERSLAAQLEKGVYAVSRIVKGLIAYLSGTALRLTLVGSQAFPVGATFQDPNPADAAMFGLALALPDEYRRLTRKCVDIDSDTDMALIREEILADGADAIVAYRDNRRYIQEMEYAPLEPVPALAKPEVPRLREGGLYVITGGMGALGLLTAEHLSQAARINLLLINRSHFPEEESTDPAIKEKSARLKAIRERGCQVLIRSAIVTEEESMIRVLAEARSRFGPVRGVIHAAGVAGNGFLRNRDEEQIREVLAPKTLGTALLDHLTEADRPDFFILYSSVSSVIADAGQCDYTAANKFMDAYAQFGARAGKKITAVNWPAFAETGMAVAYGVDLKQEIFPPISNQAALAVLDRLIAASGTAGGWEQLIVGKPAVSRLLSAPRAYLPPLSPELLARGMSGHRPPESGQSGKGVQNIKPAVILTGKKEFTATERRVADVLGGVLGLTEVDVNSSFSGLGGNSILAVKAELDMEESGIMLTLSDLYSFNSIVSLALHADRSQEVPSERTGKIVPAVAPTGASAGAPTVAPAGAPAGASEYSYDSGGSRIMLEGVEPLAGPYYKNCFYSGLLPVILSSGANIQPFLMNDIVTYSDHRSMDDKDKGKSGSITINEEYLPLAPLAELLQESGIRISSYVGKSDVITKVRQGLKQGNPVMVSVDGYFEPNLRDCYQKQHVPHAFLIYGFDDAEQCFYILEPKNHGSMVYDKLTIGYSDLVICYEGFLEKYSDMDIVSSVLEDIIYRPGTELPNIFEFIKSGGSGLAQVLPEPAAAGAFADYRRGIIDNQARTAAGRKLLKTYIDCIDKVDSLEGFFQSEQERMSEDYSAIVKALKIKHYQLSQAFPEAAGLHEQQQDIISGWEKMRNIIVKYSYTKEFKQTDEKKFREHLAAIIRREEELERHVFTLLS